MILPTMASKPILYGTYTSPSVNAVLMTFKALNVDYEFREVRPLHKEHQTEEYLRKNPTGTIPALETEDHQFIGDSHAIMAYVVDRYAKDDSLYPKDLYKRAKVHQLQHFSDSVLFTSCVKAAYAPIFARQTTEVSEQVLLQLDEAFVMMERFLSQHSWVAGDQMTIADFNCICSMYALYFMRPFTEELHPNLHAWITRMMGIPYVFETLTNEAMSSSYKFLTKYVSKL